MSTPQELKEAALLKRRAHMVDCWKDKTRPQSPPCENCGKAKTGPVPQPLKGKK